MACPICFGGDDLATRESLNAGIGVLMGVTVVVLACFARLVWNLARRSRESAHLVTEAYWMRPVNTHGSGAHHAAAPAPPAPARARWVE
jgi:hypothetical protein